MKKNIVILACLILWPVLLYPEIRELAKKIDTLHEEYKHAEIIIFIEGSHEQAGNKQEAAELYWRLSRATLYSGDIAEDSGRPKEEILAIMEKAEVLADTAIALDSSNPAAYFWKASALGRWGQVKGVLDSLAKAKPMKEQLEKTLAADMNYSKAYQVMGILYEALPGWPISFGDADTAVNLGRKALDLHLTAVKTGKDAKIDYSYHKDLAKHLFKRNWNRNKRLKEQEKKRKLFEETIEKPEKYFTYEGSITIPSKSDREEAEEILQFIVRELQKKTERSRYEEDELTEARELLAEWKG